MAMVAAIGGLEGRVDGSGSGSISLGQAQLVCLCRAALRKVLPPLTSCLRLLVAIKKVFRLMVSQIVSLL